MLLFVLNWSLKVSRFKTYNPETEDPYLPGVSNQIKSEKFL